MLQQETLDKALQLKSKLSPKTVSLLEQLQQARNVVSTEVNLFEEPAKQTLDDVPERRYEDGDCCNILLFKIWQAINEQIGETNDIAAMWSSIFFEEPTEADFKEAFPDIPSKVFGIEHMYFLVTNQAYTMDVDQAFYYINEQLEKPKCKLKTIKKWLDQNEDLFYRSAEHVYYWKQHEDKKRFLQ